MAVPMPITSASSKKSVKSGSVVVRLTVRLGSTDLPWRSRWPRVMLEFMADPFLSWLGASAVAVTPAGRVQAPIYVGGAGRSTGAVGAMGWLLGGDGWPPGQLPPLTGRPPRVPAAWWASATRKPSRGSLLSPLG
jgi:hypothetical protein